MAGDFLLDTNIVIAYLEHDAKVVDRILQAQSIILAPVVLGELYFGAIGSTKAKENLTRIESVLRWSTVANCNESTALIYGELKQVLRRKGRLIPDNDIWVAAAARQANAILVSRDRHFAEVEGLQWETW